MFEKQNIQETVNELKSDAVKGLTDGEAFRRLQQNGRNEMKAARKKTKIQLFLEQLKDPLIYILLIAAVVSVFLGELSDAVIIGTVVVVNALVGMLQEGKARKALEALKKLTSPQTIVIREGIRQGRYPSPVPPPESPDGRSGRPGGRGTGTCGYTADQKLQSAGRGIRPDRRIGTCGKRCAVSGRLQTRDSIG